MMANQFDPVTLVITREEIEAGDIRIALSVLQSCLASRDVICQRFEQLDVAFHGFNDDSREIFEVPEVREFMHQVDSEFPYWLYFLTKHQLGLQAITFCFLPPYLTEQAKRTLLPQYLDVLLNNRWWPAMNHICGAAGFTEDEIEHLSKRVLRYYISGPFKD